MDSAIFLGDWERVRAERLHSSFPQSVARQSCSTFAELTRRCQERTPVALAMPLDWPEAPPPAAALGISSPVLAFLRAHGKRFPIIVYADTTRLPIAVYCRALAAGARQVVNLASPRFVEDLTQTLLRLLEDHQNQVETERRLGELFAQHGLIGQSPALREVFHRVIKASHLNDLPLLILGETGTGKQLIAEAVHKLDPKRSPKPFLSINCSAISKSLAESELFGHVRGAFSGADTERLGVFRAANGGTLLLDEVSELHPELQPKLLRVLQERRLLPVGEDYEHPIDIRIIAATNRPLEQLVAARAFREDLYQRLNVFQIRIPPLRERPEDIDVQARHFLRCYQTDLEPTVQDFGPRALEALHLLPWEGNTRQLENLIRETLVPMPAGPLVQLEDLPRWVLERVSKLAEPASEVFALQDSVSGASEQKLSLNQAVEEYERHLLKSALQQNGGNRTRTAAELGLTPRSIFNKIKKYQLE
jgi:transcriptional regulator with PAS, ATPase and Fis domain